MKFTVRMLLRIFARSAGGTGPPVPSGPAVLLESSGYILLESGGFLLLE